ncbi:3-deoxy-7-phosphoheptulonate synthase [Actinomadura sp. 6N118]|uniref:3-deoxy-7-phosphoheptulonate synthase n=1 Tax=Actinomadura sp. 6N118 TaxID=3375151 RepID=UPI0037883692
MTGTGTGNGQNAAYESLSGLEIARWLPLPAAQQPKWDDPVQVARARAELADMPGLVDFDEVNRLRTLLADVAYGRRQIIQAGDCAEDPRECAPDELIPKISLLHQLAAVMRRGTGLPVVHVGRFAGQFGKPRSASVERLGDAEIPVFRGHAINSPQPEPGMRRPDPVRLLTCYHAAASAMTFLRNQPRDGAEPIVWTSHEALLLDYELPLLRRRLDGALLLSSTHWPWVGDRTRQPEGAHVRLLASVANPVACKIGPTTEVDELVALCAILDPLREPGRLTLIARLGAKAVSDHLPDLVSAVRAAGHPAIWLCDPMHANTVTTPAGRKTRYLERIVSEVRQFTTIVADVGGIVGGLHLEATPEPVTECVPNDQFVGRVDVCYTTACDPRLNPEQAVQVAAAWNAATTRASAQTTRRPE